MVDHVPINKTAFKCTCHLQIGNWHCWTDKPLSIPSVRYSLMDEMFAGKRWSVGLLIEDFGQAAKWYFSWLMKLNLPWSINISVLLLLNIFEVRLDFTLSFSNFLYDEGLIAAAKTIWISGSLHYEAQLVAYELWTDVSKIPHCRLPTTVV